MIAVRACPLHSTLRLWLGLLVACVALVLLSGCDGIAVQTEPAVRQTPIVAASRQAAPTATPRAQPRRTPTATPRRTPTAAPRAQPSRQRTSASGLPLIGIEQLPREAQRTIELIESDGPFPYDKDGATFSNREGLLPSEPRGYYAEYTVITPGSDDRGARRIIAGRNGELYYTDDHYASFAEVDYE